MKKFLLIASLFLVFSALPALAADPEVIRSFHSRIVVNQDSSIIVTETILVHAAGDQIKRGIYRDFPTAYKDVSGNIYRIGFKVVSVMRDGQLEAYHSENIVDGVRTYFGSANVLLPEGDYTYEFTYHATKELGFFSDHDELYWNVTGNGWAFPIESASAEVILPPGILTPDIRMTAYTGAIREQGTSFLQLLNGSVPTFSTTNPLPIGEGLTIVVGWPKGFVDMPLSQNKEYLKKIENYRLAGCIIAIILLLAYYLWAWYKVGRDPKKGAVIPQYDPPRGLSPAQLGQIRDSKYDQKFFAATIINMAIKKYLTIEEFPGKFLVKKRYRLNKIGKDSLLSPEEKIIALNIFSTGDSVALGAIFINGLPSSKSSMADQKKRLDSFTAADTGLKAYLKKYKFYSWHFGYLAIGIIYSILIFAFIPACSGSMCDLDKNEFGMLLFAVFMFGAAFVWSTVDSLNKLTAKKNAMNIISLFSITVIGTVLFAGVAYAIYWLIGWQAMATFILLFLMNVVFIFLMHQNTEYRQKLLEEIEGFIWFMTVTEKDRMNFHNPPERTPELFEKFLPYALALGVENKWAKQFSAVFAKMQARGTEYIPAWYLGTNISQFNPSSFTSDLSNSFSRSVSSTSVAPGSSSGFSGGSGGGGGGGGGGGW